MSFTCEICLKNFTHKCSLKTHIKSIHEKLLNFKCETCGKNFNAKSNLTRHIKLVHDHIKDFECNICHKRFSRKSHLQSHINLIHINPKDNRMSRSEMNIKAVLELLELNYVNELKFEGLIGLGQRQLRFDFGIQTSDKWLLIEYDGIQHFKPVAFGSMTIKEAIDALKVCQAHDRIKNDYCIVNGYPLLRLTSQHLPDLKDVVSDFVKSHSSLLD